MGCSATTAQCSCGACAFDGDVSSSKSQQAMKKKSQKKTKIFFFFFFFFFQHEFILLLSFFRLSLQLQREVGATCESRTRRITIASVQSHLNRRSLLSAMDHVLFEAMPADATAPKALVHARRRAANAYFKLHITARDRL
jgi:hypothetical protein